MIRFKVFENDKPASSVDLDGAYLFGADRVPLRSEIRFVKGELQCRPRGQGAFALAIPWTVPGCGRLLLETTRLLDRDEPYNLHVELARGQMMRISQKREDWGLYELSDDDPLKREIDAAVARLVEAMTADDHAQSARAGEGALLAGVQAGERLGCFHADRVLRQMQDDGSFSRRPLGCAINPTAHNLGEWVDQFGQIFDYTVLPFDWSFVEPEDDNYRFDAHDRYVRRFKQSNIPLWGAGLLSLDPESFPPWLEGGAGSYEQFRDRVTKHLRRIVNHFKAGIHAWQVVRGLHADNPFNLTFEQIIDLTRLAVTQTKKLAPSALTIVGLTCPWGEYYVENPRTIPPHLYAQVLMESGVPFDAFGVDLRFGREEDGLWVRDMMQISSLLDRLGAFGKPLHVTSVGIPSGGGVTARGVWRDEWNEATQRQWLVDFYRVALSKPFVESITWQALADRPDKPAKMGLLRVDGSPKPAFREINLLQQELRRGRSGEETA